MGASVWTWDRMTVTGMASSAITMKNEIKTTPSAGKVIISLFGQWRRDYYDLVPRWQTISSQAYIKTVTKNSRRRFLGVRPHKNPAKRFLLHGNAWPHPRLATCQVIIKFCLIILKTVHHAHDQNNERCLSSPNRNRWRDNSARHAKLVPRWPNSHIYSVRLIIFPHDVTPA